MNYSMRISAVGLACCMLWLSSGVVGAETGDAQENLDAALLEDLAREPSDAALDEELTRELTQTAGDDVGEASSEDWLALVRQSMDEARSTLAARDVSGRASAAQGEVVSQLEAVIARLDKQCQACSGGECDKPGQPKPGPPKNGSPKRGGKPGAANSQTKSAQPTTPEVDVAAMSQLVKDLWGQLPQRQREQIMQPFSERFVPEYAEEIEDYFRALAEPREENE